MRKHPDTDGGWAWFVLVAVFSGIFILTTTTFMGGVTYVALLERYHGNKAKTALIGSLNAGLLSLLGPVASVVVTTFSCRVSIISGGILNFLAFLISAFVEDIDVLVLTYGVMGGIGNALASTPYVISLGYYFERRRNTVISLATAFIGIGMFTAAPLGLLLLDIYGLHGTFLILSAFNANVCVVGMICRPSYMELSLHKTQSRLNGRNKSVISVTHVLAVLKRFHVLFNLSYLLFNLSSSTWNFTLAVCLLHLPNYIQNKGATDADIGLLMTYFSVANSLGRFLASFTVGKNELDSMTLHVGMLGIAGIIVITFPMYGQLPGGDVLFVVFIGLYTGGPNAIMSPIMLKIVGVEDLAAASGFIQFFCGVGFSVGPPIAGYLYGVTSSYDSTFIMSGIIIFIGCFLAMLSDVAQSRSLENNVEENQDLEVTEHFLETTTNNTNSLPCVELPDCNTENTINVVNKK